MQASSHSNIKSAKTKYNTQTFKHSNYSNIQALKKKQTNIQSSQSIQIRNNQVVKHTRNSDIQAFKRSQHSDMQTLKHANIQTFNKKCGRLSLDCEPSVWGATAFKYWELQVWGGYSPTPRVWDLENHLLNEQNAYSLGSYKVSRIGLDSKRLQKANPLV